MRQRNGQMSTQIDQMQIMAKNNASLMEKTNRLVLNLIRAKDLSSLIKALLTVSLKNDFSTEFSASHLYLRILRRPKQPPISSRKMRLRSTINNILIANKAICGKRNQEEVSLFVRQAS